MKHKKQENGGMYRKFVKNKDLTEIDKMTIKCFPWNVEHDEDRAGYWIFYHDSDRAVKDAYGYYDSEENKRKFYELMMVGDDELKKFVEGKTETSTNIKLAEIKNILNIKPHVSQSQFLNIKQAAEYLGVSTQTVRRRVKAGRLPYRQVGRAYRFEKRDLDNYLNVKKRKNPIKQNKPNAKKINTKKIIENIKRERGIK